MKILDYNSGFFSGQEVSWMKERSLRIIILNLIKYMGILLRQLE